MIDIDKLKAAIADPDQAMYYHGDMAADLLSIISEWEEAKAATYDGDILHTEMPKASEVDKTADEIEEAMDGCRRMSDFITLLQEKVLPEFLSLSEKIEKAVDEATIERGA